MFLGGKTSNYTVMKMPISVCCASTELKGQLDTKKIAKHCCFFFREESILKLFRQRRSITKVKVDPTELVLENINFEDVLYSHDPEMKHRDQKLLAT